MKKLIFLLAATMFIVSCGSDNEDGETQTPSNEQMIIGKWVKYEQSSASAPNFYDAFSKDTLTFRQDGTYTEVFEGSTSPINGTYSIYNTRLLLGELFVYDIIFENNNTMRLKEYGFGSDNGIYRFRRLK